MFFQERFKSETFHNHQIQLLQWVIFLVYEWNFWQDRTCFCRVCHQSVISLQEFHRSLFQCSPFMQAQPSSLFYQNVLWNVAADALRVKTKVRGHWRASSILASRPVSKVSKLLVNMGIRRRWSLRSLMFTRIVSSLQDCKCKQFPGLHLQQCKLTRQQQDRNAQYGKL